jgi:acyl-CoA thioester hydrolase
MSDTPFTYPFRVRWPEVDAQGVVFNGHYLSYADHAGTEFYRHLGLLDADLEDLRQTYVVDAHISFKASALNDDLLTTTVTPERIGKSSFTLLYEIRRDDTLLTQIRMTYVRALNGQSVPLSDAFRAILTA